MQHHWKYCQSVKNKKGGADSPQRPALNRVNAASHSATWTALEGIPAVPMDPPPLEDNLAKHIIHVMSRFTYQIGVLEERDHGIVPNHSASATSIEIFTNINGQSLPTDIMVDIYKAASRVIAYVSASNWTITFAKIKNRILYLTTTTEENPEITDVMLLECASLNAKRLSMILTGKKRRVLVDLLTYDFFVFFLRPPIIRIMQFNVTLEEDGPIIYRRDVEESNLELD